MTVTTQDPVAEFNRRVEQETARGMDRRRAVLAVAKADRQLHREYLQATNSPVVHRLIADRFAMAEARR